LSKNNKEKNPWEDPNRNVVTLTSIEIPKPVEPEQPRQAVKPQPVAQRDYQQVQIVRDILVTSPIVENDELKNAAISNTNEDGPPPQDLSKGIENATTQTGSGKEQEPENKQEIFDPIEVPPSFPGGPAALALFFSRNINPPTDLEPGEKKVVMVKFVVGADGTITQTEVTQSSGEIYDREVLRAFRKMPKWNPAIQNGHKTAVAFTQPVTFMGEEEN
jgi:protein TonB